MGGRIEVVLIVLMLSVGPVSLIGGTGGTGDDRGPVPFAESSVWTDSFDDLSHVFVPQGGLVGVEDLTLGSAALWVDRANDDYRPAPGSVLRSRVVVPPVPFDTVNQARAASYATIGAYED